MKRLNRHVLSAGLLFGMSLCGCATVKDKPGSVAKSRPGAVAKGSNSLALWKDGRSGTWKYYGSKAMTWDAAEKTCANLALKTKRRWRLPAPKELRKTAPVISSSKNLSFGWMQLGNVWTAQWDAGGAFPRSVYLDFTDRRLYSTRTDAAMHVMCVRTDDGKGSVVWRDGLDLEYRYMVKRMNWMDANNACKKLANTRKQPWRMPTTEELQVAIRRGIQTEKNRAYGRDFLNYTWSNVIESKINSSKVYAVNLHDKRELLETASSKMSVLCVRSLSH